MRLLDDSVDRKSRSPATRRPYIDLTVQGQTIKKSRSRWFHERPFPIFVYPKFPAFARVPRSATLRCLCIEVAIPEAPHIKQNRTKTTQLLWETASLKQNGTAYASLSICTPTGSGTGKFKSLVKRSTLFLLVLPLQLLTLYNAVKQKSTEIG